LAIWGKCGLKYLSTTLDESVAPAGTGSQKTFLGAADNFVFMIGTSTFTGQNGRVQQNAAAGDFFSMTIGDSNGTVNGMFGSDIFTKFTANWNGSNLFGGDAGILAHDLTEADFGLRNITLRFNDMTDGPNTVIDHATAINFGSLSPVPLPGAVWLFGSALFGLIAARKVRK